MKQLPNLARCISRDFVPLTKANNLSNYERAFPCLYFARNEYQDEDYRGIGFTLFAFPIVKETKCFYFLNNTRVNKSLTNKYYQISPQAAVEASIKRARNYLDILIRRGQEVNHFLRRIDSSPDRDALTAFDVFLRSASDPDIIAHQTYRAEKESFEGLI